MKGLITSILSICPLRSQPDDSSEMISQVLFGEQAEVLEKYKENWIKIRLINDQYVGWADQKQFVSIESRSDSAPSILSYELFHNVFSDDASTWITLGAELHDYDGITANVGSKNFRFSGQVIRPEQFVEKAEAIEKMSKRLLNAPYLWGGRSPFGIDCSGFTQLIFKCVGIAIARDSSDQALSGQMIDFVSSAQCGDLAFFTKKTDKISHVGIVLPDNQIIHASGKVRIDTLDHYGIFNNEIQQYTHRLKIIKRYI